MEELTKHYGVLPATWRQDLSAALEHEKPVITEALVDSINAANLGFTVSLKPWMKNQSESDLQVRLGKQDVRNDSNLLQIGELSEKHAKMAVSTPPTKFHSALRWPQCANVINRQITKEDVAVVGHLAHFRLSTVACASQAMGPSSVR